MFVLQVRVILLDSLTLFHKYSKQSLSVTFVTRWNPYSIFQTNTGYSVGFSQNAAQCRNSEIRMFLGTPCLPAKMIPGKHSLLVGAFQWLLQSHPYLQLCIPAPSNFSGSAICLIPQKSHLLQKLTWGKKKFFGSASWNEWLGKKIFQVSGGQKLRVLGCQCWHLSEVTFQSGLRWWYNMLWYK